MFEDAGTGQGGRFEARGVSLSYFFDDRSSSFRIKHLRRNRLLHSMDMREYKNVTPAELARTIEKASQIFALSYSNRESIDLCETVKWNKLRPIVETITTMAGLSHTLKQEDYTAFTDFFVRQYGISHFDIEDLPGTAKARRLFASRLASAHDHRVKACAFSLHELLRELSERIVKDAVVMEYNSTMRHSAQILLNLSVRLAMIGHIMDESFIPGCRDFKGNSILITIN